VNTATPLATTTTADGSGSDPVGYYQFSGLVPGCYKVQFGTPAGYVATVPNQGGDDAVDSDAVGGVTGNYTLASGDSNQTVDAGFYRPATLGDFVWLDLDRDGVQDVDEVGINDVEVTLYRVGDPSPVGNQLTANDGLGNPGYYLFEDLAPGLYYVVFSLPSEYAFSPQDQGGDDTKDSDANPATGQTGNYTLVSGQTDLTVDAGLFEKAIEISATPYCDKDAPWVDYTVTAYGFTPGLATIEWVDANGTVVQTLNNQPLSGTLLWPEAAVDGNGVGIAWPGWAFLGGQWVAIPTNVRPQAKLRITVNPTAEVIVTYPPATPDCAAGPYVSLGNLVFHDRLVNGKFDAGVDEGIDGVVVELWSPGADGVVGGGDDALVDWDPTTPGLQSTVTTSGGGWYLFTRLPSGKYYTKIPASEFAATKPLEKYVSTPGAGVDETTDHPADENGVDSVTPTVTGIVSSVVNLQAGFEPTGEIGPITGIADNKDNLTLDFGFVDPALGNLVWNDLDFDGVVDAGEPGIAGVKLELLDGAGNPVLYLGNPVTTVTDANGFYLFSGLGDGTYRVRVALENFGAGKALENFQLSTYPRVNADNQVDDDNNGVQAGLGQVAVSAPIVLTAGSEPTDATTETGRGMELDNTIPDNSADLTVDFGFVNTSNLPLDFGDAPTAGQSGFAGSYPTTFADNGGRHVIVSGFSLGSNVDAETDGQPTAGADGDDNNPVGSDDEDGVFFLTSLRQGQSATVVAVLSNTAGLSDPRLGAWIDWNQDGDWDDAGEQVFASQALASGPNGLSFTVPGTAGLGTTYARFRLSDGGGLTPGGLAANGEVEDYQVVVTGADNGLDWGDLPDLTTGTGTGDYQTLASNDGARHTIPTVVNLRLGQLIDGEANGQPGTSANHDDLNGSGGDDEDGVTAADLLSMPRGGTRVVNVSVYNNTGSDATLWGWIDFDADGAVDPGETQTVAVSSAGSAQNVPLTFSVPSGAADSTYARFRLGSNSGQVTSPTGLASDGEVEDYVVTTTSTPTAARLAHFRALTAGEGVVQVVWGTLVENGVLGFRVDRSTADGGWERLTAQMIPATGGNGRPQSYGLVDDRAPAAAGLLYRLVEVDLSGREQVLAVATVEAGVSASVARTATGLSLNLRGAPNASVTVQTAVAVEGPWTTLQAVTLDGAGAAVLNLGLDYSGSARFYRVVSE
jgi:hypothetical protein